MKNAQIKTTDAQIRATKKYINAKWRPSVYFDKSLQLEIENHIAQKGYASFNQYVVDLVKKDMNDN